MMKMKKQLMGLLFQVPKALAQHLIVLHLQDQLVQLCEQKEHSQYQQGKVTSDLIRSLVTLIFSEGWTLLSLETV